MFRLALRSQASTADNKISKQAVQSDHVLATLDSFATMIPQLMLFLRSVKKVSIYVKSAPHEPAMLLYSSTMSSSTQPNASHLLCEELTVTSGIQHGNANSTTWLKVSDSKKYGNGVAILLKDGDDASMLPQMPGRIYATMQLFMAQTQLPLHINAPFTMRYDKRGILDNHAQVG